MLKQIVRGLTRWAWRDYYEPELKETPEMTTTVANTLLNASPQTIIAHPISNGYILRLDHSDLSRNIRRVELIYAKDAVDVAEQIIAAQARHKLDISPKQGDLFSEAEGFA